VFFAVLHILFWRMGTGHFVFLKGCFQLSVELIGFSIYLHLTLVSKSSAFVSLWEIGKEKLKST